jgi:hypothetical protein
MTRYLLLGIFTLLGALAMPDTAFSANLETFTSGEN